MTASPRGKQWALRARQFFDTQKHRLSAVPQLIEVPIPSPGERVAPEGGRERNSGSNPKVSTNEQTSSQVEL